MSLIRRLSPLAALPLFWTVPAASTQLPAMPPEWMAIFARDVPGVKDDGVAAEIKAFRQMFLDAAAAKDEAKLQKFYAPNFTVTHGSGYVETRESRIANVLRTGGGSEVMTPIAQSLRSFGRDVAVTTQVIPFAFEGGPSGFLRVATILNRVQSPDYSGWRIVAMQLNTLDKPAPARRVPSGCEVIPMGNVPPEKPALEPEC